MTAAHGWRDSPDARWIRVLVRVADLPVTPSDAGFDFRDFDEPQWAELATHPRYLYLRHGGQVGRDYIAWRAIPDDPDTIEDLKQFVVGTLWWVFVCTTDTQDWQVQTVNGEHVPMTSLFWDVFTPREDALFVPSNSERHAAAEAAMEAPIQESLHEPSDDERRI